jgi:hypothetical protein
LQMELLEQVRAPSQCAPSQQGRPRWPQARQVRLPGSKTAPIARQPVSAAEQKTPETGPVPSVQQAWPRPPHVPHDPSAAQAPAPGPQDCPMVMQSLPPWGPGRQQPSLQTFPGQQGSPGAPHSAMHVAALPHCSVLSKQCESTQQGWPEPPHSEHFPLEQTPSPLGHAAPSPIQTPQPSKADPTQQPGEHERPGQHVCPGEPHCPQTLAMHATLEPAHVTPPQQGCPSWPQATQPEASQLAPSSQRLP